MNTMIIYSSKYGSTASCAQYLESRLPGSVSLVNIDKTDPQTIRLEICDTIIVGSSVYVGAVSKKLRALCTQHADLLLRKSVGIFLCCGFSEQSSEYFTKNFSAELLKHATAAECFGGEARLDQMGLVDKLIMKAATKGNYKALSICSEKMDNFINALKS